ncbi:MAG: hypothetical protein ACRDOB_11725 [Streptosporangiaceae bacterium]
MRMNISVPDQLAEEVRRRDVAISAVCQRALRDEVARLRTIEAADDITVVIESEQAFLDPAAWAAADGSKPVLVYRRHPEQGWGWTLWYELGEHPGGNPDDYFIPGDKADVDAALRAARERLRRTDALGEMGKITVNVGDPSLTIGFTGRWLLEPDSGKTRTSDEGWDNGVFWGVALTQRGRIAVFAEHCNSGAGRLDDYDNLDQAAAHVPADVIARAAAELGETRVLWRDI